MNSEGRKFYEQDLEHVYNRRSRVEIGAIGARYGFARDFQEGLYHSPILWLDIGTNKGFGLAELVGLNGTVIAVDLKEEYLREAARETDFMLAQMDATKLGLKDESVKVVTAFEVIEHVPEADRVLQEAYRVLEKGGLLFLSTPNKPASGNRRMSPDHKKEFTAEEMAMMLQNSGFTIISQLGQAFLSGNFRDRLFKTARENPWVSFAYYHLMPWAISSKIRDGFQTSQDALKIRKPKENEMSRGLYFVCSKQ